MTKDGKNKYKKYYKTYEINGNPVVIFDEDEATMDSTSYPKAAG